MRLAQKATVCVLTVAALMIFLYAFDPITTLWSPKCLIFAATGYKCPGCGIQRLLHHALHGDITDAMRYNYFAVIALPYAFALGIGYALPHTRFVCTIMHWLTSKPALYTYIALYMAWWIIRNLFNL